MTPEQQQTRAWQAKELLNNELLSEALQAIEKEVVLAWGECPARDTEGKEQLWQLYKTAQKFKSILNGYIETGKLATEEIKRKESLKEKIRRVF